MLAGPPTETDGFGVKELEFSNHVAEISLDGKQSALELELVKDGVDRFDGQSTSLKGEVALGNAGPTSRSAERTSFYGWRRWTRAPAGTTASARLRLVI